MIQTARSSCYSLGRKKGINSPDSVSPRTPPDPRPSLLIRLHNMVGPYSFLLEGLVVLRQIIPHQSRTQQPPNPTAGPIMYPGPLCLVPRPSTTRNLLAYPTIQALPRKNTDYPPRRIAANSTPTSLKRLRWALLILRDRCQAPWSYKPLAHTGRELFSAGI